jgi:hypothetical protein
MQHGEQRGASLREPQQWSTSTTTPQRLLKQRVAGSRAVPRCRQHRGSVFFDCAALW